jgi:hypothetical protein
MGGWHCVLLGPLGTWPAGQQVPVDVLWLARQHALPIDT